tara:strand:- start:19457 stop:20131 length:675 start_codon:yes stop_codon:yes gene_type:complete
MKDFYKELGLSRNATLTEIKKAYRSLAKKYHPDTGGSNERFIAIQEAWEVLNNAEKKEIHDQEISNYSNFNKNYRDSWSSEVNIKKSSSSNTDQDIKDWIRKIYFPINRYINQVIKPLNGEIKKLSADPYDDELMENFCLYINLSRKKIEKAESLYKSQVVPTSISSIGLDLYHCFSQVKDALAELDRYTQGYVDDYLFDGKQMMKEATKIQLKMKINKKNISL